MKTILLSTLATIALAVGAQAQTPLLQFNTFGNAGTETSEPSVFNDPSVTASTLTLGAGINPVANSNRLGGNNYFDSGDTSPTDLADAIADNEYFELVLTPAGGSSVTPTSLVFGFDRSGTGPNTLTIRSSADSFATNLGTSGTLPASVSTNNLIAITGVSNLTTPTTFRIYAYGATGTTGTGGFDTTTNAVNISLNAGAVPAPEPSTLAMIIGGAGSLMMVLRMRRKVV